MGYKAILAFLGGIVSHRLVFIHGELDDFSLLIIKIFICLWALLIAGSTFEHRSPLLGVLFGSVLFILFQAGLGISIFIYRLYFHPLRQFSAQTAYILTQWAASLNQFQTNRYFITLYKQHMRYGTVIRAGPNYISVNDVTVLLHIYSSHSLCKRGPWHDIGGRKYILQRTRDRQAHDQEKMFWVNGFSSIALDYYVDRINEQVRRLLIRLSKQNKPVDLTDELKFYGFNVTCSITFSKSYDDDQRSKATKFMTLLEGTQRVLGILGHVPWAWTPLKYIPGALGPTPEFYKTCKQLVEFRLQNPPQTPDLVSWLLPSQTEPFAPGFPLIGECTLALTGGSILNSFIPLIVFYFLSRSLYHLQVLQAEVTNEVRSGKFNMQNSYPILDSIIKESMRLMPAFPNGGQMQTPPQGLRIGDTWIPGGVTIKVPFYTIFRDGRYFADPHSFVPERWTTRPDMVINPNAFVPFLLGAYSCVAKDFAMMQTRAVVAHVVAKYDIYLSAYSGMTEFEHSGKDYYLMFYGPLWVNISLRPDSLSQVSESVTATCSISI